MTSVESGSSGESVSNWTAGDGARLLSADDDDDEEEKEEEETAECGVDEIGLDSH